MDTTWKSQVELMTPWLCCQWCVIKGPLFMRPWHAKLWLGTQIWLNETIHLHFGVSTYYVNLKSDWISEDAQGCNLFEHFGPMLLEGWKKMTLIWGRSDDIASDQSMVDWYYMCWMHSVFWNMFWLSFAIPRGHALSECFIYYYKLCCYMQAFTIVLGWLTHVWGNTTALVAKGFCLSEKHLVW